jgi:acyl-CoA thioester hydrolase
LIFMLIDTISVEVRYAEVDQMEIVYYSRYFEYFEIGRLSLLRFYRFPYNEMESKYNCYLPVVETYAKFYNPAKLEDVLTIETKILEKPSVMLKFDYEISREETLIAKGYTTHVFLNGKTGKPGRPPIELKKLFDKNFP